jgi:membrane associated rhomboid family serine protease
MDDLDKLPSPNASEAPRRSTSSLGVRLELAHISVVVLSGVCSGAILGACIPTETERKVRTRSFGLMLFSNGSITGILLNNIIGMLLVGTAFATVAIGILDLGHAYPLSGTDRYVLVAALFVGVALAKWLRYRYWKRRKGLRAQ